MRKGFVATPEAMYAILGVVFIVIIFLLASGLIGEGLPQASGIFQEIGSIWDTDADIKAEDYQIAKQSVSALACAIDSSISGKELACVKDYQEEGSATLECRFPKDRTESWEAAKKENIFIRGLKWGLNVRHRAQVLGGDVIEGISGSRLGMPSNDVSIPDAIWQGCKVIDFNLPQDIEGSIIAGIDFSPEAWISGYGDPKFITYWQQFPEGEERAWTGFATWMQNVGTIVLFALPVGSLFKAGKGILAGSAKLLYTSGKAGMKTAVKETITGVLQKIVSKESKEAAKVVGDIGVKEATERLERAAAEGVLESDALAKNLLSDKSILIVEKGITREHRLPVITEVAEEGLKAAAKTGEKNMWSKVLTAGNQYYKDRLKNLWKVVGVSTAAAWAAAHIDSVFDKYEKHQNALVLDSPYRSPLPLPVKKDIYERVGHDDPTFPDLQAVILLKKPDRESTMFYAVSPCKADLRIVSTRVFCKKYYYDKDTGDVFCDPTTMAESCRFHAGLAGSMLNEKYWKCSDYETASAITSRYQCEPTSLSGEKKTDSTWCYVEGYEIEINKDSDYEGSNFCFTEDSEAAKVFLTASIAVDVALAISGVGLPILVPLNVLEGYVYVKIKQSEEWPG